MKQYNFKNFFFAGLSVILLFPSCQSQQRKNTENQNDTILESVYDTTDTTTIADRFWNEDEYQSSINLEFAQAIIDLDDTSQISIFDKVCAVQVTPDTSWLTKYRNEITEDDWDIILDDKVYYDYEAEKTLNKHDIPTYYAPREKRYLKFIKADKSCFIIDLTKMLDAWGLILFNGNDNPVLWDNTDIDRELKEIYKK